MRLQPTAVAGDLRAALAPTFSACSDDNGSTWYRCPGWLVGFKRVGGVDAPTILKCRDPTDYRSAFCRLCSSGRFHRLPSSTNRLRGQGYPYSRWRMGV